MSSQFRYTWLRTTNLVILMTEECLLDIAWAGTALVLGLGLITAVLIIIEIFKGGYQRYVDMDEERRDHEDH